MIVRGWGHLPPIRMSGIRRDHAGVVCHAARSLAAASIAMNETEPTVAPDEPNIAPSRDYPVLFLKKGEDDRLRQGHLWVFSNEVDVVRSPLDQFVPGQIAAISDSSGRILGLGYVNPQALVCARLMERGARHAVDRSLIVHRLQVALALRQRLYGEPFYRLVFGEADGLPGLVLDRYDDVIVGQIGTLGMEQLKTAIVEAVVKVIKPRLMVWKNHGSVRRLENLPEYVETAVGVIEASTRVVEAGIEFWVDIANGQKTGWFYDQRDNRERLPRLVAGKRVLDVFSYVGAWGLRSAALGASAVLCIDSSAPALAAINAVAQQQGLADRVQTREADAFDALKELRQQREHFDVVIVDPPAFIKRKKDFAEGRIAYRRIFEAAMQVLSKDGILIACSCSHHLPRAVMLDLIQQGARHLDRSVQVLAQLQQSKDHPVHPAIPETDYLKGFICRVLPA